MRTLQKEFQTNNIKQVGSCLRENTQTSGSALKETVIIWRENSAKKIKTL
jgi:hypothetical protein